MNNILYFFPRSPPDCNGNSKNFYGWNKTETHIRKNGGKLELTREHFSWRRILLNLGEPHEVIISSGTKSYSIYKGFFSDSIEVDQNRFHEDGTHCFQIKYKLISL